MASSSGDLVARRILELVADVDAGRALALSDIRNRFGIGYHRAREYLAAVSQLRRLQSERRGRFKVWTRVPSECGLPPSVQRAAALDFAAVALSSLEGTEHHHQLRDLAEIERNALSDSQRLRLQRLSRNFRPVRHERPVDQLSQKRWIALILDAIERRLPCAMHYETLEGVKKWYEIDPWGLLLHRGRLLFAAGKRKAGSRRPERRFFHFEGILSLEAEDGPAFPEPRPEDLDFDSVLRDSFGIYCLDLEPTRQVHLRVRGAHAVALRQRSVHGSQHLTPYDGTWWDLRLTLKICPEFRAFVLGMIPDVIVLEPAELRQDLARAVGGWMRSFDPK